MSVPFDLDSLLEHSSDVIVVLDDTGRLTYVSPSLETLSGFKPAEMLGRYGFELVHSDERRAIVELFGRLHERPQGPLPVSFRLARADGSHIEVEAVTTSVVQDDHVHGVVVNIRDVAARRRIEERARSRERQAQAVLDALQEGVLVCGADGTVLSCNSSAERLLGRPADQLVGSLVGDLVVQLSEPGSQTVDESGGPVPPGEHPVAASLRHGEALADLVLGHLRRDGSTRWWRFATELISVGASTGGRPVVVSFEDITERRRSELAERAQRDRDRTILDSLREGVLMFSTDARVVVANSSAEELFEVEFGWMEGLTHEEMVTTLTSSGGGVFREDGNPFPLPEQPVVLSRDLGVPVSDVVMGISLPGGRQVRWFQVSSRPLLGKSSDPPFAVVVSFTDISGTKSAELERRHLVELLGHERETLSAILSSIDEGIIACDSAGMVTVCNEAMRLYLALGPSDDPRGAAPSVASLHRPDGRPLRPGEHPLLQALAGSRVTNAELVIEPAYGIRRVVVANGRALRAEDGSSLGAVVAFHDVTAQRRLEAELTDKALHDPLTGLANRILLSDRLEVALERSARENAAVGVMLCDLDDFKLVNDTLGHSAGDQVLVTTAERLRAAVRPGDTVARLGGDEFVIVCPILASRAELDGVRERLQAALGEPHDMAGRAVTVTGSIGVAIGRPGGAQPELLLRAADEDMYRAKDERRRRMPVRRG